MKLVTHVEITLIWMPQNLTGKKSTLIQVMAWCLQAASVDQVLWCYVALWDHNELIIFCPQIWQMQLISYRDNIHQSKEMKPESSPEYFV